MSTNSVPAKVCDRCGCFLESQKIIELRSRFFCNQCGALPEVDYLETFKQRYWGQINHLVIMVGLLSYLAIFMVNILSWKLLTLSGLPFALGVVAGLTSCLESRLAYQFLGAHPDAFHAMPLFVGFSSLSKLGLASYYGVSPLGGHEEIYGFAIFAVIVYFSIIFNPVLRLAFEREISDEELTNLYQRYVDNPAARYGRLLAFAALIIPGLEVASLILCGYGLASVDDKSFPPVGNRNAAVVGIILSLCGFAIDFYLLHWYFGV